MKTFTVAFAYRPGYILKTAIHGLLVTVILNPGCLVGKVVYCNREIKAPLPGGLAHQRKARPDFIRNLDSPPEWAAPMDLG